MRLANSRFLDLSLITFLASVVLFPAQRYEILNYQKISLRLYTLFLIISLVFLLLHVIFSSAQLKYLVSRLGSVKLGLAMFGIFLSWGAFSLLWTPNFAVGLGFLIKTAFLLYPLLFVITIPASNLRRFLTLLFLAVFISNVLSLTLTLTHLLHNNGIALFFKMLQHPAMQSSSSYVLKSYISTLGSSFVGGKNVLAAWSVWAVLYGFYFWRNGYFMKLVVLANTITTATILLLTFSRSALVSLLVVCLLLGTYYLSQFERRQHILDILRSRWAITAVGVMLILGLSVLTLLRFIPIIIEGVSEGGVGGRLDLLSAGISNFLQAPFVGTGVGSPTVLIPKQVHNINALSNDNYHNGYIEVLSTYGIVGFLLLLTAVGSIVRSFLSLVDINKDVLSLFIVAPLMGYLVQALFMYNFNNFEFYLAMSVIIAFVLLKNNESANYNSLSS